MDDLNALQAGEDVGMLHVSCTDLQVGHSFCCLCIYACLCLLVTVYDDVRLLTRAIAKYYEFHEMRRTENAT